MTDVLLLWLTNIPMARSVIFSICTMITLFCRAQVLYQNDREMMRRGLSSTTTYVQLLGDPDFDERIRESLSGNWTFTRGIEFVEPGGSLGDPADPGRSYISIWRMNAAVYESYLVFWQGGRVWERSATDKQGSFYDPDFHKSWIVAVPIDRAGRESKDHFTAWRIPLMVRSIVQLLSYAREHDPNIGRAGLESEALDALRASSLRSKTLLVWNGRFSDPEIAMLREHYHYPLEVVEMKVILDAIAERDPAYAILMLIQGGYRDLVVHDASTYDILFAKHDVNEKAELDIKEVKALAKAVEK